MQDPYYVVTSSMMCRVVSIHLLSILMIPSLGEGLNARLVNGTIQAGRLEIFVKGEWGPVCNNGFGKTEAKMVCSTLGFDSNEAAVVSSVKYGHGSRFSLLNSLSCHGIKTSLAQCWTGKVYSRYCNDRGGVGVICNITDSMKARLVNGKMHVGRLEIYFNEEWGTVCEEGFEQEEAQVACRMLGFNSTDAAAVSSVRYGPGSGKILLGNVRCQGNEGSLAQCDVGQFYPRSCKHVSVVCNISRDTGMAIHVR